MNIGSLAKTLEGLDSKGLGKVVSGLMGEKKLADDMKGAMGQLLSSVGSLQGILGGISSDLDKCHKAMKTKSNLSDADKKEAKKMAAKLMKTWQANRTKLLEQQISDLEKQLSSLRKQLASVKGAKPEGWFM